MANTNMLWKRRILGCSVSHERQYRSEAYWKMTTQKFCFYGNRLKSRGGRFLMAAICEWRERGRMCICIHSCKCGKRKWVFHYIMSGIFFCGQVSCDKIEGVCFITFTIKAVNLKSSEDSITYCLASIIQVL
jgi:hypothetical protein